MADLPRRSLLSLAATSAGVALAGCTGGDDDNGDTDMQSQTDCPEPPEPGANLSDINPDFPGDTYLVLLKWGSRELGVVQYGATGTEQDGEEYEIEIFEFVNETVTDIYRDVLAGLADTTFHFLDGEVEAGEPGRNTPEAHLQYGVNGTYAWTVWGTEESRGREWLLSSEYLNESCLP